MTKPNKFAVVNEAELNSLRQDSARWHFFVARVAKMANTTVDEMTQEIDAALKASRTEGGGHGHLV